MELETTIAKLAPGLLRYCRARLSDAGLAEETAQDALTALVERWRRHGSPRNPQAFAFAVARRRAARLAARQRLLAPLSALFGAHHPDPEPDEEMMRGARRVALQRALGRLPARDREALMLVAVGEVKQAAAADLLGISSSALKMRLHRARRRLQGLLEEDHGPAKDTRTDYERA